MALERPGRTGAKMNDTLDRAAQCANTPEHRIDEKISYTGVMDLTQEQLEDHVKDEVQQSRTQVQESMDHAAAQHPDEAACPHDLADATRGAHNEHTMEAFDLRQEDPTR